MAAKEAGISLSEFNALPPAEKVLWMEFREGPHSDHHFKQAVCFLVDAAMTFMSQGKAKPDFFKAAEGIYESPESGRIRKEKAALEREIESALSDGIMAMEDELNGEDS